jgi:DNA-binding winged helix-turn-helix (wHTH) protein/Tfp pilus assembly protein PilF
MPGERDHILEFGRFRLQESEGLLRRDGTAIPLAPTPFKILCVLAKNGGRLLEKEELMHQVWSETFVEESNLIQHIAVVRRALGDSASNGDRIIETVPRRGYRFLPAVRVVQASAVPANGSETAPAAVTDNPPAYRRFHFNSTAGRSVLVLLAAQVILLGLLALRWNRSRPAPVAASRASSDPEANDLYLRGLNVLERRSSESSMKAVEAFELATRKDPNFAQAYAGLAVAYTMHAENDPAEQAASKALELGQALPETHAAMGFVQMFRRWNWAGAEREFRRAIQLDPGYARAHHWYAILLEAEGRLPEARVEMARALELQPLSPLVNADYGQLLVTAGEYQHAAEQCRKTLDLDPDFQPVRGYLHDAYFELNLNDALVEDEARGVSDPQFKIRLLKSYSSAGMRGFWKAMIAEQMKSTRPFSYDIARWYALLGDRDQAFYWLQQEFQTRRFFLVFLKMDPAFSTLRPDPRYRDLLQRVGLPAA